MFVVICKDDDGMWRCWLFDDYEQACRYADGIAQAREPMVYERTTYRWRNSGSK